MVNNDCKYSFGGKSDEFPYKALNRHDIKSVFMLEKYVWKDRSAGGKFEKGIRF